MRKNKKEKAIQIKITKVSELVNVVSFHKKWFVSSLVKFTTIKTLYQDKLIAHITVDMLPYTQGLHYTTDNYS